MEERIGVVKPVACRPTVRAFSVLLSPNTNASTSNSTSQPVVLATRPKTVRVKPVVKLISPEVKLFCILTDHLVLDYLSSISLYSGYL